MSIKPNFIYHDQCDNRDETCSLCLEEEDENIKLNKETTYLPIVKNQYKETSRSIDAYNKAATSLNKETDKEIETRKKQQKSKFAWTKMSANNNKKNSYSAFSCLNLTISLVVLLFMVINIYWFTGNMSFATKQASNMWHFFNKGEIVNLTQALVSIYTASTNSTLSLSTQPNTTKNWLTPIYKQSFNTDTAQTPSFTNRKSSDNITQKDDEKDDNNNEYEYYEDEETTNTLGKLLNLSHKIR
jgi:hypothetical protein